jgi:hypothetical protein
MRSLRGTTADMAVLFWRTGRSTGENALAEETTTAWILNRFGFGGNVEHTHQELHIILMVSTKLETLPWTIPSDNGGACRIWIGLCQPAAGKKTQLLTTQRSLESGSPLTSG